MKKPTMLYQKSWELGAVATAQRSKKGDDARRHRRFHEFSQKP